VVFAWTEVEDLAGPIYTAADGEELLSGLCRDKLLLGTLWRGGSFGYWPDVRLGSANPRWHLGTISVAKLQAVVLCFGVTCEDWTTAFTLMAAVEWRLVQDLFEADV
jgi:hypothetical protein